MNTQALREYKSRLTMTGRQRQLLEGMLLGDAHLERQRGAQNARLKIEHSVQQAAYVDWKYSEWRDWVRTPPKERDRPNRVGTVSVNRGFTTLSHEDFNLFRTRFCPNDKKVVPQDLVLTPLSVAVWFMDDGSRKSSQCRGLYFNTQSFSESDIKCLRSVILRDIGVETTVRNQRDGLQIYIPSRSVTDMVRYMSNEMIPSMRYKLPG
jgi:hypothetical protein